MDKKHFRGIFVCLTLLTVITATILFSMLYNFDKKGVTQDKLYKLEIVGEYSEEGSSWKPLTPQVFFQNLDLRNITVRGHFNQDLPKDSKIFLNIDHLWVTIQVNGQEIYALKPEEKDGNPTRALGKQWVTVVSPGISTEDVVEISFGNLYRNAYIIQFDELLWQMYTGDKQPMLLKAIQLDSWTLAIGTAFAFLTFFLLIIAGSCAVMQIGGAGRFLWLGLATMFSALWFFTLSPAPTLLLPFPVSLNVLYAISMQAMAIFIVIFAAHHVTEWRKSSLLWCVVLLIILLEVAQINQILHIQDLYSAINYFSIFDLLIALWMVYAVAYESHNQKRQEATELLKAMCPLAFFAVLELINGYIQFSKAAIMLGLGLVAFVVTEGIYTLIRIKKSMSYEKQLHILSNELNQSRISIMLSQIQPHFLYNTLNSISALCSQNPEKAEEMVDQFAEFLRGNLDTLTAREPIPFLQEKQQLDLYLAIEKTRFGERLEMIYDYQVTDFRLPSLTLQPIVENAVRHGVTKKKGGGTIVISTWETDHAFLIQVSDNGVGFDMDAQKADNRSHIGLENVRSRIQSQCGGSVHVESQLQTGTSVTITIPKQEVLANEICNCR